MAILDIEEVLSSPNNMGVAGTAYVRAATESKSKNDSIFIKGFVCTKDGEIPYKIWSGKLQEKISRDKTWFEGAVVELTGKVNEYNGSNSLIIENAIVDEKSNAEDYLYSKYDLSENSNAFLNYMKENLSPEGKKIFSMLFEGVGQRFFKEFASITTHHDNTTGGLTAHSFKCVRTLGNIIGMYPNIMARCDKDLLYIGVALHDMGKAIEYDLGKMSWVGNLLSHRTLAVEMTVPFKSKIVELKNEEWYARLLSIFEQHHGEYEESPRTVEAYLTHLVDNLESSTTDLDQAIEKDKNRVGFWMHGFNLS